MPPADRAAKPLCQVVTSLVKIETPPQMDCEQIQLQLRIVGTHPMVTAIGMDCAVGHLEILQRPDRPGRAQWKFRPDGRASVKRRTTSA